MPGTTLNVWSVIASIKSINRWQDTLNSNIGGVARVGYREADVMFKGGISTTSLKTPTQGAQGAQVGEQTINISHTTLNWKQAELVRTNGETDFGIQGDGFFMVSKVAAPTMADIIYTRDGQFHIDSATGNLVTNGGYFVLGNNTAAPTPINVPAGVNPVSDILTNNKFRLASFPDLQALQYSPALGATYFEPPVGTLPSIDLPDVNGFGRVVARHLEASNVNINRQIIALNDTQKIHESLAKQLTVFFANFDIGLNLIK